MKVEQAGQNEGGVLQRDKLEDVLMSRLSAPQNTVLGREGQTNQRAAFRAALGPQTDTRVRLLLIV